jgi:hypothetical protein
VVACASGLDIVAERDSLQKGIERVKSQRCTLSKGIAACRGTEQVAAWYQNGELKGSRERSYLEEVHLVGYEGNEKMERMKGKSFICFLKG